MPRKKPPKQNEDELLHYRMDVLERRQEGHEAAGKLKDAETAKELKEMDDKMNDLRLELMKVVTKVAIAGYVLGAVGSFMLQKFAK